ncbi:surface-adhesin E family protein [Rodentibacter pneumotropicus]|uniref:Surface-adhesin protein E-like domain-containing protein n=1 Tax=Rodentibacter pneumotropicus TaxID=758 RepID=A0A4S2QEM4_9PAST|nr:surface-adhesin E family protein [Rodentibacter pneumotropicus]MDC2824632.1 hypothetical protein [Rodentibacter pneumotropicus]THA00457.1 hypothetical protein D3M79_03990 [Rodentibacter pneumotropicus]THA00708.1 hypothetical protein D3M74_06980 [Rodentibacter pneumotropicus]THA08095.1 hypothetical protein D3M77_05355 [Rodentibacter pneumotropicus]THA14864.1 hypothetical protein D3M76_06605 [Rodentibacter pneumotropicus]
MKKLLVCFLLCISSASIAANWIPSKYPGVYIGKVTNQGIWIKFTYPEPTYIKGGAGKVSHFIAKVKSDCKNDLLNIVQNTYYQEDGSVVRISDYPIGFAEMTPDSIGESILKAVCSYKSSKK